MTTKRVPSTPSVDENCDIPANIQSDIKIVEKILLFCAALKNKCCPPVAAPPPSKTPDNAPAGANPVSVPPNSPASVKVPPLKIPS